MPEYSQETARRYLELQGYFVRSNIPYKFVKHGGGAGWSDVDPCALHPTTGRALAMKVKGWHTEAITPGFVGRTAK